MKKLIACLTLFSGILVSCQKDDPKPQNNEIDPQFKSEVIAQNNTFAIDIFKEMESNDKENDNLFISPISMYYALGMVGVGSASETRQQFNSLLGWGNTSDTAVLETMKQITDEITPTSGKVTLETANSLWQLPIFPIYDSYKSQLTSYLNAEARVLDFTQPDAVDIINGWIEDKTHDKVQDMLDQIPDGVVMYLINAVYFKGDWKYTFEEKNTQSSNFYVNNATFVPVQLMHQMTYLKYYENKTFSMVSLPYADSAYRMLVLLPSEQNTLNDLLDGLTPSTLSNWQNEAKYEKVNIYLPKFKFAYGTRLINEELKSLGLTDAFDASVDFSKITPDPIMISRVLHKSFIEVNEQGSEAAAATIVETWETSAQPDHYDFVGNRPFIFAICHEPSNTILFIGKLANPSVE